MHVMCTGMTMFLFLNQKLPNKLFWILNEGCKSDEILEWVGVFLFFQTCYSHPSYIRMTAPIMIVHVLHVTTCTWQQCNVTIFLLTVCMCNCSKETLTVITFLNVNIGKQFT